MTPKEKAEELINKMFHCDDYTPEESMAMLYPHAKQCALIAVDEIIKSTPKKIIAHINIPYSKIEHEIENCTYLHWQEVKHEIEKL